MNITLIVFLTALGVGGATITGSVCGFIFKGISDKFSNIFMSFAAGVMLTAAINELVLTSLSMGGRFALLITVIGVFSGAICINLLDKLVPQLNKLAGFGDISGIESLQVTKTLLLFAAIAIHNLPEGFAAGVGFGSGNISDALTIAGGIALQNIPEGMIVVAPMLKAGISRKRTFFLAASTGVIEIFGTLIGYFAVLIASAILPFALAFAGGTMLYVTCNEMIPEIHSGENEKTATYALLAGFCLMLVADFYL